MQVTVTDLVRKWVEKNVECEAMSTGKRCHLTRAQAGILVTELEEPLKRDLPSLYAEYLRSGNPWVLLHGTLLYGAMMWPIEERRWLTRSPKRLKINVVH